MLTWLIFRASILTPWLGYLCVADAKFRRLPNWATLGGLLVGLCVQSGFWGWNGFKAGLCSAGIAMLFLLIPFLLRASGAGDVKMLAAAASFLLVGEMPLFLMAVSFAGLFVAIALLCARKVSVARLRHIVRSAFDWTYDRKTGAAKIPPKDDERTRIPFGIAIAFGMWFTLGLEFYLRFSSR